MISRLSGRPRPFPGLPQLCCTNPLSVYPWQSTLVFSPGFNYRCLSHSTQPPLTTVGVHIMSQLGSAGWNWFLWWILFILPYEYLLLCPPLRFQSSLSSFSPERGFLSEQKCFLLHGSLSEAQVPVPNPLSFSFFLCLLPCLILWRLVCLLVSLEASANIMGRMLGKWCLFSFNLHLYYCELSWAFYLRIIKNPLLNIV